MRPAMEDLVGAANNLEHLAYEHDPRTARNPTGWPDVAALLELLVWYNDSIADAKDAAAYGPGVKGGYHTLHRGGHLADIEARTRDQYLKDLKAGRMRLHHKLGQLIDEERQHATNIGRYPDRSEQAG